MRTYRQGNDQFIRYRGKLKIYEGEYLPHWEVEDGIYFVTFRLADSIPQQQLVQLKERYHGLIEAMRQTGEASPHELAKAGFEFFLEEFDTSLDEALGACWLAKREVAEVVAKALEYFDGERYSLYAWCIMPNHVHVAFRKENGFLLKEVLHSWKSYTSNAISEIVPSTTGEFWYPDYYDRLIRTTDEFENVCQYIVRNPSDAGFREWEWVGVGGFGGPVR